MGFYQHKVITVVQFLEPLVYISSFAGTCSHAESYWNFFIQVHNYYDIDKKSQSPSHKSVHQILHKIQNFVVL